MTVEWLRAVLFVCTAALVTGECAYCPPPPWAPPWCCYRNQVFNRSFLDPKVNEGVCNWWNYDEYDESICKCYTTELACLSLCGGGNTCYSCVTSSSNPCVNGPCIDATYKYRSLDECQQAVTAAQCNVPKYTVCLYECGCGSTKNTFQTCVPVDHFGVLSCPSLGGCGEGQPTTPTTDIDRCQNYDCSKGKKPFNPLDKSACQGPGPDSSKPPCPSPDPKPDSQKCHEASYNHPTMEAPPGFVFNACNHSQPQPWEALNPDVVPLECTAFCSGKIMGGSVQACMQLLQGSACLNTLTDVEDGTCRFTPFKPASNPHWCYPGVSWQSKDSRPTFQTLKGMEGLRVAASQQGRVFKQDLSWEHPVTKRRFSLRYDVEHTETPVVLIDTLLDVVALSCGHAAEEVTLHASSPEGLARLSELFQQPTIITAGREWGCRAGRNNEASTILRRVIQARVEKTHIVLKTAKAGMSEAFRHADIRMSSAAWEENHVAEHAWSTGPKLRIAEVHSLKFGSAKQLAGWGWWDSVCDAVRSAWHWVQNIPKEVEKVAETIGKVIEFASTGDFDYAGRVTTTIGWNYDASTGRALVLNKDLGHNLTCTNCFFDLDPSVNFDLNIKDYKVTMASMWVEGSAKLTVDVDAQLDLLVPLIEDSFNLASSYLDAGCVTVGLVPICIALNMTVDAGINITVGSSGRAQMRVVSKGDVKHGVYYDGQDDSLHHIQSGQLEPLDTGAEDMHVAASASLQVGLFPKLLVTIDHIGGPTVGLRGVLEVVTDTSTSHAGCEAPSVYTSLSFGVQASVGALVDVKLPVPGIPEFQRKWDALLSLSNKWPISQGCWAPPSKLGAAPMFTATVLPLVGAMTFAGTVMPSQAAPSWCAGSAPLGIALQVTAVPPSDVRTCSIGQGGMCPAVVSATNAFWTIPASQTTVGSYTPFSIDQAALQTQGNYFVATADDSYVRQQSISEEGMLVEAITWDVLVSDDSQTVTITPQSSTSCYGPGVLHRNLAAAKASFHQADAAGGLAAVMI